MKYEYKKKYDEDDGINKILRLIDERSEDISFGFAAIKNMIITDWDSLLEMLVRLFEVEEKEIEKEKLKPYTNDLHEGSVKNIARDLWIIFVIYHKKICQSYYYKKLLCVKYMGYGFFKNLFYSQNQDVKKRYELIIKKEAYYKCLYMGMVTFFEGFYGWFADNEEAIELICKYYPENINLEQYEEKIVKALYTHMSIAGTSDDVGYAFRGINLIEQYIKNIPVHIVKKIIKTYNLFSVVNNKVCRHQLYSIISFSTIEEKEKEKMKFWCIDSILIANYFDQYLLKKLRREGRTIKEFYSDFDVGLTDEKLQVFEIPNVYWSNNELDRRVLYIYNDDYIKIKLQDGKIKVNYAEKNFFLEYNIAVWNPEKEHQQLIEQWLEKNETDSIIDADNKMLFSFLYLDGYRGLKEQILNFDHRFEFDIKAKKLRKIYNEKNIRNFYGENVYSLSCIVGKNGTGKTSIVNFLRETFFKLLMIIEENDKYVEDGFIEESIYEKYGILEKGVSFFIVFMFGKKTFFLTNIKDVCCLEALPFKREAYMTTNDFSKVVYFSNMLRSNQDNLFGEKDQVYERNIQKQKMRVLNDFRQIDYSETASFIRRFQALTEIQGREGKNEKRTKGYSNKDLYYQLFFLYQVEPRKICNYLDIDISNKFYIRSNMYEEDSFFMTELFRNELKMRELLKKYLRLPNAKLYHFSSGQYAKFSFLAKLYYFLNGYKSLNEFIGEYYKFDYDEVLLEKDTALLFIDEGELYYHPEWQRRYIFTFLKFVNGINAKLQIIFTTNSPFILSDILKEDVVYLQSSGEKKIEFECTFGQNIHRLLMNNFFMNYTIGEYSKEFIQKMIYYLQEQEKMEELNELIDFYFEKKVNKYEAVTILINQLGEPVYQSQLEKLLEESSILKNEKKIQELERKKRILEEEIERLRKEEINDTN